MPTRESTVRKHSNLQALRREFNTQSIWVIFIVPLEKKSHEIFQIGAKLLTPAVNLLNPENISLVNSNLIYEEPQ